MSSTFKNDSKKKLYSISNLIRERKRHEIVLIVFALTMLTNLIFVFLVFYFSEPNTGTTEYQEIARNIAQGNGFVLKEGGEPILWRPPLYIYILSFFYHFSDIPYCAIVAFQIVLNAMTGVVVFLIGERVLNRSVGFFSAVLLSIYPLFVYNCLRLMPEALFAFLISIIVLLTLDFLKGTNWKLSILLGLFLGLASLSRAAIQFYPIILFFVTVFFLKKREKLYGQIRNLSILAVIMLATILPWTIRNYVVSKEFIFLDTSGGYTFWIGNRIATDGYDDDPLTEEEFIDVEKDLARILELKYTPSFDVSTTAWASGANSSKLYLEGIKNIIKSPSGTLLLWFKKLYRLWFSYIGEKSKLQFIIFFIQIPLLVAAVFGIYLSFRDGRSIFPLILMITYFSVIHMAATANVRHSVAIIPYVIILAVYVVDNLKRRFLVKRC
ncbi:MAG: ArnT family glycosyltransferase [Candidatus Scalinduaceae bacterium]